MWDGITEPEDRVGLGLVSDILEQGSQSVRRKVAMVVAPLASSLGGIFGKTASAPAAEDLRTLVTHAGSVIIIDMEVGEESDSHFIVVWFDRLVHFIDKVIAFGGLRLVGQIVDNVLVDVDLAPLFSVTYASHESAELLVV